MTARLAGVVRRRSQPRQLGPARFLLVYLALLYVLPARIVVPGTGALGSPATLVSIAAFGWWFSALILGQRPFPGSNIVRTMLLCYLGVVLASWINGKARVQTPLEMTTSDRALLTTFGLVGIALVAMDGIASLEELDHIVRWLLRFAMVMVGVGMIQFFFGYDAGTLFELPGLQVNQQSEFNTRSDFSRPHATALHPIEFGVVSAALIPLGYWYHRRARGAAPLIMIGLLAFAAMTSLSRSAVLAAAVCAVVLFAVVGWRQRLAMIVAACGLVVVAGVLVDGLVGTLRSLFASADEDPSVQARVDRVPRVLELISEHPWFGRGFGTYTPEEYFLLDNELQKVAIERGFVGAAALVGFVGFCAVMAWRSRVGAESQRLVCAALAATILGLFLSSYTFDAFFYRILTGTLYLCIGIVGAMYRLTADARRTADGLLPSPTASSATATATTAATTATPEPSSP